MNKPEPPAGAAAATAAADDRPLEPLSMTVHSVNTPHGADPALPPRQRTARGRWGMFMVLAVCAAPVVASYLMYYVIKPQGRSNYGQLITPTRSMPPLQLVTLEGKASPATQLRGQWLLVAVGPAGCEGACEKRLFMQRQLRETLGRDRDRLDKLWLVTDTAEVPPALRQAIGSTPPTTVLRADRAALAQWLAPEAGRALEDHLYVVDPMGEWMMRFPVDADPSKVKRDLERLMRASAGWDRAGR